MKKLCTSFKTLFYTSALMALTMGVYLSSCSKDDSGTGVEQSEIQNLKANVQTLKGDIAKFLEKIDDSEKDPQAKAAEKSSYADEIKDISDRLEKLKARLQEYIKRAGGKDKELQNMEDELKKIEDIVSQISKKLMKGDIKDLKDTVSQFSEKLGVKQNLVEIPDIKFRSYLKAIIPDAFPDGGDKMDANSHIVKSLRRIELAEGMTIESLKGIEYFTALTYLNIDELEVKELDVSHNTALVYFSCSLNSTTLDLSQNKALAFLDCSYSELTNLDLSQNKALVYLNCSSNKLTSLNLEHNTALTELNCNSNKLTSLNLEHNTALTQLKCNSNNLTSLDLSHNCKLIRSDTNLNPQEKGNDATVTWCPER